VRTDGADRADVVVLDMRLRGAVRAIRRSGAAVLALVTSDEELLAAMRAGARGCVHADAGPAEVARAARRVAAGEVIFGPELATRLGELVGADDRFRVPDRTVAISRAMAATLIR
jgi:DNA-binding NarL/FixJ family response regulator